MTAADREAPPVTVLMAVHNGERFVEEAVQSILRQTFTDFEFLIIDDASTDTSAEKIAAFGDPRIRMLRNPQNIGLTRSLNRGLAEARGALIARQDADDRSYPTRLARQVAFLRAEPGVAVVGTQARTIDARGRSVRGAPWPKSTHDLAIRWQLLFDSPFIHTSVMFRKSVVLNELGGYDEEFTTSQDFELWSRVAAGGHAMRNLPATLVDFRTHTESMSARYERASVHKVGAVLLETLTVQLGAQAVPPGWPEAWIRMNNPRLFRDAADDSGAVARSIETLYEQFVAKHPGSATESREIRRHVAAMLIRVANLAAERGRIGSVRPFARAASVDASMAASAAPRYLGHLLTGRWRRRTALQRERTAEGRAVARPMVELARKIYKSTPVPALRKLYFGAFCRVMQHRRVRATINGATFDLDLGEMIDVALYLEQYELEVTAALRHYCRPGMTVMDVGANIGAHTLTMGRLVAPGGSVYAFEPTDFAFAKLQHNASLNDAAHIHLVKVALSEHNSERQAVGYRSSWRTSGGRSDAAGVADFVRLDDWCARHGVDRLDVMKIDIDGNEFEALAGGLMLLERTRPVIVIEAVWPHFADPNRNPFVLLSRLGYRFWDAKSHLEYTAVGKIAALFPDGDRGMTVSINVIARPMSLSN